MILQGLFAVTIACCFLSLQSKGGQQPPPTPDQFLLQHRVGSSIQALRRALRNSDPDVRGVAAGILAERRDVASIPLLKVALACESVPRVKASISNAIAELDRQKDGFADVSVCKNSASLPSVRLGAALKSLDRSRNECLSSVVNLLASSPDGPTREMGYLYLSRITSAPAGLRERIQMILVKGLSDPITMNREHASEALGVLGDADAIHAFDQAIHNETDAAVRRQMEQDLSRLKAGIAARSSPK